MVKFVKNPIEENIDLAAAELKQAREKKYIDLKKAAKDLKISPRYLAALEEGNTKGLPAGVYGRNFLREYAFYLGLEPAPLLESFFNSRPEEPAGRTGQGGDPFSRQAPRPFYFLAVPKIMRGAIIVSLALALAAYLAYSVYSIVSPPALAVSQPPDDITVNRDNLTIIGQTETEADLTINNENILVEEDGSFSKRINLQKGINTITIKAQKKYSRENIITRKVLWE